MTDAFPKTMSLSQAPRVDLRIDRATFPGNPPIEALAVTTCGLLGMGQKEIVVCVTGAGMANPGEILEFYELVLQATVNGSRVNIGGLTEFGDAGLFGNPFVGGVGYACAHSLDPLLAPLGIDHRNALVGVLLTRLEVACIKRWGLARILTGLGRLTRTFPYPVWSEPTRGDWIPRDQLDVEPIGTFTHLPGSPGAVCLRSEGAVQVFVNRLAQPHLLKTFAAGQSEAIATDLLPGSIDGALAWTPGEDDSTVLTPGPVLVGDDEGSIHALSANFLAIGRARSEAHGVSLGLDGFWVELLEQEWDGLVEAVRASEPYEVHNAGDRYRFALGWIG